MYLIVILSAVVVGVYFSFLNTTTASYTVIAIEALIAMMILGAYLMMGAFHNESMRGADDNPTSSLLLSAALFLTLLPLVLVAISSYRLFWSHTTPFLNFIPWLLISVVCAAAAYGLMILDEKAAPAAAAAKKKAETAKLVQHVQAGDVSKACELVRKGTTQTEDYFAICKKEIESLDSQNKRWREFEAFTVGANFIQRTDDETRSVIPVREQGWFLQNFFQSLLSAPPVEEIGRITTAPTKNFDDLLALGNLLNSLAQPGQWDLETIRKFVLNVLPGVLNHYASRLHAADEAAKSQVIGKDGFVDQTASQYKPEAESAYDRAKWVRNNFEKLKAL